GSAPPSSRSAFPSATARPISRAYSGFPPDARAISSARARTGVAPRRRSSNRMVSSCESGSKCSRPPRTPFRASNTWANSVAAGSEQTHQSTAGHRRLGGRGPGAQRAVSAILGGAHRLVPQGGLADARLSLDQESSRSRREPLEELLDGGEL